MEDLRLTAFGPRMNAFSSSESLLLLTTDCDCTWIRGESFGADISPLWLVVGLCGSDDCLDGPAERCGAGESKRTGVAVLESCRISARTVGMSVTRVRAVKIVK